MRTVTDTIAFRREMDAFARSAFDKFIGTISWLAVLFIFIFSILAINDGVANVKVLYALPIGAPEFFLSITRRFCDIMGRCGGRWTVHFIQTSITIQIPIAHPRTPNALVIFALESIRGTCYADNVWRSFNDRRPRGESCNPGCYITACFIFTLNTVIGPITARRYWETDVTWLAVELAWSTFWKVKRYTNYVFN